MAITQSDWYLYEKKFRLQACMCSDERPCEGEHSHAQAKETGFRRNQNRTVGTDSHCFCHSVCGTLLWKPEQTDTASKGHCHCLTSLAGPS